MRRFFVLRAGGVCLASVLVLDGMVSCVDLASLGDGTPDAAPPSEAGPDAPAPSDPCAHAVPPPPPDAGASAAELPTFVLAVDSVVGTDPGHVPGFDLDGVCTCDTRPGSVNDGGPTCAAAMVTCDFDGGADNAFGAVAAAASPIVALDTISNRLITTGSRTLLLQIAKYNGQADDDVVVVGSILGEGIHAQGCPSSTLDTATQLWSKGGCGDDPWTVSPSSIVQTGSGMLPLVVGTGYVHNYQLVVRFGDSVPVPFDGESNFRFATPLLVGTLVPLDESLAPRDAAAPPTTKEQRLFRLEGGVLAGRALASDLLATLGTYRPGGTGAPLCTSAGFDTIRSTICGARDIGAASASASCDALSAAFGFVAIPAAASDIADASVTSSACAAVDAAVFACP